MARITPIEVEKRIKAGDIKAVYYLTGKEKYFHDRIINLFKEILFNDAGSRSLNISVFYGTENNLSEMLSACMDYPMLSDRKLVIVKDFSKMKLGNAEALEKYIAKPVKSTVLVISSDEGGRSKIFQTLSKKAEAVSCDPIREYDLNNWIFSYYNTRNIQIDRQACQFLVNQIGSDLLLIENEINKIRNYKNDDSKITVNDLLQTSGATKQVSIFALQNALSAKQLGSSLKVSKNLLESGENIIGIINVLFAFYRKTMIVASLKSLGKNQRQISEESGLSDFQLKNIYSVTQRYSMNQIGKIIELLKIADTDLKTSNASEKHILNMLCFNICSV